MSEQPQLDPRVALAQIERQQRQKQIEAEMERPIPAPKVGVQVTERVSIATKEALASGRVRWCPEPRHVKRDEKREDRKAEKRAAKARAAASQAHREILQAARAAEWRTLPCNKRSLPIYAALSIGANGVWRLSIDWRRVSGAGLVHNPNFPFVVPTEKKEEILAATKEHDDMELSVIWFAPVAVHTPLTLAIMDAFPLKRESPSQVDGIISSVECFYRYRMFVRIFDHLVHASPKKEEEKELTEEDVERRKKAEQVFDLVTKAYAQGRKKLEDRAQESLEKIRSAVLGPEGFVSREDQDAGLEAWLDVDREKRQVALDRMQFSAWCNTMLALRLMEMMLLDLAGVPRSRMLHDFLACPELPPSASEMPEMLRAGLLRRSYLSLAAYADYLCMLPEEHPFQAEEGRHLRNWISRCLPAEKLMERQRGYDGGCLLEYYWVRFAVWTRLWKHQQQTEGKKA